jgi:hypothetical protein
LLFHVYSMPMNLCFFKPPSSSPVSGVLPLRWEESCVQEAQQYF